MRNEEPAADQHRGGEHPEQPPTLTVADAARVCGVSTSTIRRYLRQGVSPAPGKRRARLLVGLGNGGSQPRT